MLTSKQLLEQLIVSRETLNNYLARGPQSTQVMSRPGKEGERPPQIGNSPEETPEPVIEKEQLKQGVLSMDEPKLQPAAPADEPGSPAVAGTAQIVPHPAGLAKSQPLVVTVDQIPHPAYMVNHKFEVVWFNDKARDGLDGALTQLAPRAEERSIFRLLIANDDAQVGSNREELLRLNLALAKERMELNAIVQPLHGIADSRIQLLERLYAETMPAPAGPIVEIPLRLKAENGNRVDDCCVYAAHFREGILVILVPQQGDSNALLQILSRRDAVIRNLLSKRLPALTDLAVLVADLQDSVKICSELPPEEYFELINQIWSGAGAVFRKYYGTHGKHVGDGMVYYFFPQPDCSYIMNALACAQELKTVMGRISKEWQLRKKWTTELYLNTGLNEGEEWLGTFETATAVEFAVLGDTINHTARLSDFARYGAIWATKNFIGKVPGAERARVKFGIRRPGPGGQSIFVESTYSRLGNLVDLASGRFEKLRDIAGLPVTEIVELGSPG